MSSGKICRGIFLIVAIAAASAAVETASAAKRKLTYEEAWAYCKARMDKESTHGTMLQGNERFLRGGACMKNFGYNL